MPKTPRLIEASPSNAGIISTGNQTIAGVKNFTSGISLGNETLSIYDEGTWTTVISTDGSPLTHTFSTNNCRYNRIGRVLFFEMAIVGNLSAGSGNVTWSLPFTSFSTPSSPSGGGVLFRGITLAVGNTQVSYHVRAGTSNLELWGSGSATSYNRIVAASLSTNYEFYVSGFYSI